ncbi:MAG: type II toxin-antitoxin system VapB family antitoxin [Geminicoccaceae bacterium]
MRQTVSVDTALLEQARALTGIPDGQAVVGLAVRRLIAAYAARRLARLGGTWPKLRHVARRRSKPIGSGPRT